MDITFLQKNYVLVVLSLILALAVTGITNMLMKQKDEQKTYVKVGITSVLVSGIIVYIHNLLPPIEEIITSSVPF